MTGAELKEKRLARGWTQEQLREVSGASVRAIGALELGRSVAPETRQRITAALLGQREPSPRPAPRPRGFAAMNPERHRHIAALGGRTAPQRRPARATATQQTPRARPGRRAAYPWRATDNTWPRSAGVAESAARK